MEPEYMHKDPGNKSGTDSEHFTSASSVEDRKGGEEESASNDEARLVLMIDQEEKGQVE